MSNNTITEYDAADERLPGEVIEQMRAEIARLTAENQTLRALVPDLAWMARRYADGRSTYAPTLFNDRTRSILALGIELNPTADGTLFARDGMGRSADHLMPEQIAEMEAAETAVHSLVLQERQRAELAGGCVEGARPE